MTDDEPKSVRSSSNRKLNESSPHSRIEIDEDNAPKNSDASGREESEGRNLENMLNKKRTK